MKKVGYKIALGISICCIITAILIGVITDILSGKVITQQATSAAGLLAQKTAVDLDKINIRIEDSVGDIALTASKLIDINKMKDDSEYMLKIENDMDKVIKGYTENAKNIMAVYIEFRPELTNNKVYDVSYSNADGKGVFEKDSHMELKDFNPSDMEMDWYYNPIRQGEGVWSTPYVDKLNGVYMITYSEPIYIGKTIIGIAGMDVRYDDFKKIVENIKVYDKGYAFLMDKDYNFLVHKKYKVNENLRTVENGSLNYLTKIIDKEPYGICSYSVKGEDSILGYAHLENGYIVAVNALKSEVLRQTITVKYVVIAITIIAGILSLIVALYIGKLIAKPILGVAELVNKTSRFELKYDKSFEGLLAYKDEVGIMARAALSLRNTLRNMAEELVNTSKDIAKSADTIQTILNDLTLEISNTSAATEELAAGMEQTSASTQEINAAAFQIGNNAQNMSLKAQEGISSSAQINDRANTLKQESVISRDNARKVYEIVRKELEKAITESKAVEEVNMLAETILEISSRTNLLSLNAAIEASRAGESGRGFAVVAEEINKLAKQSSSTVDSIKQVVERIHFVVENLTSNSTKILNFVDEKVLNDYERLIKTGEQYSSDANLINALMDEFGKTANILNVSANNVNTAISEITKAVGEGASGVETIAEQAGDMMNKMDSIRKSSEENLKVVENLNSIVDKLKL